MADIPPVVRMPYDDQAFARPSDLPPELGAPLAEFDGAVPPAPHWFRQAIAQAPERTFTRSGDIELETLTWGEVGKPGLLLVHGNSAHADWWSFVAPQLAKDYRVAAYSLAGMGDSGWRDRYDFATYDRDMEAVARAAGLHKGGRKPVYIGHSFGGAQVYYAALRHPQLMHAAVMIDTGFLGLTPAMLQRRERKIAETGAIPTRIYPDMVSALARFRFSPAQPAREPYLADYVARRSLKRVPGPDGQGEGWTWKFDPMMWEKLDHSDMPPFSGALPPLPVPGAIIHGEYSNFRLRREAGEAPLMPDDFIEVEIPDAHHHIMVDHPLALVATIRAVLAGWRA